MKRSVICDMDGVIYRGKTLVPGAKEFVHRLIENGNRFLFLTNNSEQTQLDLKRKLEGLGIEGLTEDNFMTSAMATATFLKNQSPAGTAYVVGGGGLVSELYKAGFSITESNPEYVVVGKTRNFNFDMLKKAVQCIENGAKFIATNPDVVDPTENGIEPACGSILAAIEAASGKKPYCIGKPNALMMMIAKRKLGSHSSDTLMIGDRMDTDIIVGLEAGMIACLVLSGVSNRETLEKFPFKPNHIFETVGEIRPDELVHEDPLF